MAIIGMDIHRSFAQAAFLQDGQVKREQRVDLVHDLLIRFGKSLSVEDEVVIEATGNSAAVERILRPFVKRVVVANPRMVRAIAYARVKTDKIDGHIGQTSRRRLSTGGLSAHPTRSPDALTRRFWAATSVVDSASRSLRACRPSAPPRSTRRLPSPTAR